MNELYKILIPLAWLSDGVLKAKGNEDFFQYFEKWNPLT